MMLNVYIMIYIYYYICGDANNKKYCSYIIYTTRYTKQYTTTLKICIREL